MFPKVVQELKRRNSGKVLVVGGIIPEEDKPKLAAAGIKGNFSSGTSLETIIEFIASSLR